MSNKYHWMEPFRAKNGRNAWALKVTVRNAWVLKVTVMEEGIEVTNIEEVVDCPRGEAGVWYANNLLCRLANEAVKGTKLETYPWRESRRMGVAGASKNYMYRKVKDSDNYAKAEMEWVENI